MAQEVCMGAMMQCSFGVAPSSLIVLPQNKTMTITPVANIMDHKPIVNIPPFGMCNTPSNPVVAAATAAKLGVFTPAACVPNTAAPWVPGSPTVLLGNMPILHSTDKLMCMWGGVISITYAGQTTVMVGEAGSGTAGGGGGGGAGAVKSGKPKGNASKSKGKKAGPSSGKPLGSAMSNAKQSGAPLVCVCPAASSS